MMRVALVGCGKTKARRACQARDMYLGSLFRAARKHAEDHCHEWRILSARYGLVKPEQRIEPYNLRLFGGKLERAQWGIIAASGLRFEMAGRPFEVVVLAGADYADPVCYTLEQWGITCHRPLQGMGLGHRLQWLSQH